ncbi:DNA polymerase III subunit chi [Acinetobacter oleivorans]|uniref:DNA polymerase III subunit chi n=1 Tax=Acinetobacter oleivorans TaxID=1148157 RepID=UPI001580424A|nr:DNA polymerase III subunit chi [Acinetobacter oleivorans]NUF21399.1 DNA polymerase III subunit chi [Acinetobacter oleivorans]
MAKVSFYLFETSEERQVDSACRLCRKILQKHPKIWWYCSDVQLQQILDERLWDFDPISFIAHDIDQTDAAVCISAKQPLEQGLLVFNFNNHALEQVDHFSHIIEIVENNETAKQIGREKFKMYRRLGIEPRTFKL